MSSFFQGSILGRNSNSPAILGGHSQVPSEAAPAQSVQAAPRRGVSERIASLTSRNREFNDVLQGWSSGEKTEEVRTKIKCAKRLSSGKLDLRLSGLTSLPSNLNELRMLRCLDLRGNGLEELPGIEEMPPRLVRVEVLGNPLKKLPESLGQYLQIDDGVFDTSKFLLTIPLQNAAGQTGKKTVSLELLVYESIGFDDEVRLEEEKMNYSCMTGLIWDHREADHQNMSGMPSDRQLQSRYDGWDRVSESSEVSGHESEEGKRTFLSQMSSGHVDGTKHYQDPLALRDRLCALIGYRDADFSLNAILVHQAR